MPEKKPRHRRSGILTNQGWQRLQDAIREAANREKYGKNFTVEELSARTTLNETTIAAVKAREKRVDRKTLEAFFAAFELTLEESDYDTELRQVSETRLDWGEAVDASIFYGRTKELETLKQWIVDDRCRLVALLGMGGIGKTSLAAKLGEEIQGEFEIVVWRSLRNAPLVEELLAGVIQFLSKQQEFNLPKRFPSKE